ncbi:General substrate transporter [Macleaya cordata]|uniref:General substrate transporter n=1 Tax=Macleaya cordata TaxID=56857 RepID=A0A200R6T2_MACCD|nr:General substrate transporter [Macleaya cordata]
MNSIFFYAPGIFQSLRFGSGAALYSSIITSTMFVVATFVSMAVVDKFGRMFFFLEAGCPMIVSMLILAVILALKFGHGVTLTKG